MGLKCLTQCAPLSMLLVITKIAYAFLEATAAYLMAHASIVLALSF